MRIAFRADASAATGLGHVKRCLALAQALVRTGAEVEFLTRRIDFDTPTWIRDHGFTAHELGAGTDVAAEDARASTARLISSPPDWLVVDHYKLDARWHAAVAQALGTRIAAIDDLGDRPHAADLVVDHNLGSSRERYAGLLPETATALLGPRFALLAPAYANASHHQPAAHVASIGIFMGGTDTKEMSMTALRACRDEAGFDGPVEIATTSANPHLQAWREACAATGGRTRLLVDAPDLADFFARHGLQIGAGGGAALERCCIGAPSVVIAWVDNQVAGVEALAAAGVVEKAEPNAAGIGAAVRKLLGDEAARQTLGDRCRQLVDGRGALRVALALVAAQTLALRDATPEDAVMAHAWRNDPRTLLHSRDPAPIALADHMQWWARALADPERRLLIAHCGGVDVGTLRFDRTGPDAELSIYLDPGLTGLGLGRAVLRAGQAWASGATRPWPLARLLAEVDPANAPSASVFAATGFQRMDLRHWSWALPG